MTDENDQRMNKLEGDLPDITEVAKQVGSTKLNTKELIDELVSEVHVAATRQYINNGVPNEPKAWARTTARNKSIDLGRKHQRERNRDLPLDHEDHHAELAHHGLNPADALLREEDKDLLGRVKKALEAARDALCDESRTLWDLKYKERLSIPEISEELNVTPRIVGTRLARLLKEWKGHLRRQLESDPICWELLQAQLQSRHAYDTLVLRVLRVLGNCSVLV